MRNFFLCHKCLTLNTFTFLRLLPESVLLNPASSASSCVSSCVLKRGDRGECCGHCWAGALWGRWGWLWPSWRQHFLWQMGTSYLPSMCRRGQTRLFLWDAVLYCMLLATSTLVSSSFSWPFLSHEPFCMFAILKDPFKYFLEKLGIKLSRRLYISPKVPVGMEGQQWRRWGGLQWAFRQFLDLHRLQENYLDKNFEFLNMPLKTVPSNQWLLTLLLLKNT